MSFFPLTLWIIHAFTHFLHKTRAEFYHHRVMLSDGTAKFMNHIHRHIHTHRHTHTHPCLLLLQSRDINKACSFRSKSSNACQKGSRETMKTGRSRIWELGSTKARMATLRRSHHSAKCFCVICLVPSFGSCA